MTLDPKKPVMFKGPTKAKDPKIVAITHDKLAVTFTNEAGMFSCGTWDLDGNLSELNLAEDRLDLINIPEPKVAQEFWLNVYDLNAGYYVHNSKERADRFAQSGNRIECIHVREVLPEDELVQVGWRGITTTCLYHPDNVSTTTNLMPVYCRKGDMEKVK